MIFPEQFRSNNTGQYYASCTGDSFGNFIIPDHSDLLFCIAADGAETGWDHVSISVRNKRGLPLRRVPSWEQMCRIKDLFWTEEETVVQFHPPKPEYVNNHAFCLHLWSSVKTPIMTPPSILTGFKELGLLTP
jgi:hypothetical protein